MRCVVILMSSMLTSVACSADEKLILFSQKSRAAVHEYSIQAGRADAAPRWRAQGPPPLSVERAVAIAKSHMQKTHSKFDDFEVAAVDFRRLYHPAEYSDLWYYAVAFHPIIDGTKIYDGHYAVILLMDGSIVEPQLLLENTE